MVWHAVTLLVTEMLLVGLQADWLLAAVLPLEAN